MVRAKHTPALFCCVVFVVLQLCCFVCAERDIAIKLTSNRESHGAEINIS